MKLHIFWFDIALTYEELAFLNTQAQKQKVSHMDYLASLLRKEMKGEG